MIGLGHGHKLKNVCLGHRSLILLYLSKLFEVASREPIECYAMLGHDDFAAVLS